MRLLEIQRQIKERRKFRDGNFMIEVKLENPGDEHQEFLKVFVFENGKQVAKGLYKQWQRNGKWEPLSITSKEYTRRKSMQEMIKRFAREAGYIL